VAAEAADATMVRILISPTREVADLHRRMEQMMERLLHIAEPESSSLGWVPRADVYETAEQILVSLEIPGVERGEIEILVQGPYLRVSGVRQEPTSVCMRWHQMEIVYGPFERVVALPLAIDPEGIRATYTDGFLRIEIPRGAAGPRSVSIEGE